MAVRIAVFGDCEENIGEIILNDRRRGCEMQVTVRGNDNATFWIRSNDEKLTLPNIRLDYVPIVVNKFVSKGWNISSDGSCNLTLSTDKPNTDPQLAPLGNYGGPTQTMRPLPGSPAVFYNSPIRSKGACIAAVGGAYDQRNLPLPSYGCDTGSVEVQPGE